MNYHNITTDDMNNGDGLRVVLWLAGCSHHCKGCQNPQTWNFESGISFDYLAESEVFDELKKDYISGITLSGGDPLFNGNLHSVLGLVRKIKKEFPNKTIWCYTGYVWEDILSEDGEYGWYKREILKYVDVLIDGRYVEELRDVNLHWVGSSNQRVIDVQKSLKEGEVVGLLS